MEGRNSETWQSIVIRDHFIYVDGSIIGQSYLAEPMGEPGAWDVLVCWLFVHCGSAVCSGKTEDFMKKGGEWR
ncbi:hypothetical protein MOF28_17420 [Bacillus haynesii]|uniref:hypothetical protein n=1 Tax=Bacillus haynesii TaxID=1925021 RepID=UPI00227F447D|nr:hypothetical protein [Bacillus haynesii]MCY9340122.1 hypothetical protein [Bacillus haynesii]